MLTGCVVETIISADYTIFFKNLSLCLEINGWYICKEDCFEYGIRLYKKYQKKSNHEFDYYYYEIFDKILYKCEDIIKVIRIFLFKATNLYF